MIGTVLGIAVSGWHRRSAQPAQQPARRHYLDPNATEAEVDAFVAAVRGDIDPS